MDNNFQRTIEADDTQHLITLLQSNILNIGDYYFGAAYAASIQSLNVLHMLIDQNLVVEQVLQTAIDHSFANAIWQLHKIGCDMNFESGTGKTLLMLAAEKNELDSTFELIRCGADVNKIATNGETVLTHIAGETGNYSDIIMLLHSEHADLQKENTSGQSPLSVAAQMENVCTLSMLLHVGADPNQKEQDGILPLTYAIATSNLRMTKNLLAHGADVDLQNDDGKTSLIECIQQGMTTSRTKIWNLLLANSHDINLPDICGDSVLMHATRNNNEDVVKELLQTGARITVQNDFGETPFLLAIANGNSALAYSLIQHNCAISIPEKTASEWRNSHIALEISSKLDSPVQTQNNMLNMLFFASGETIELANIPNPHLIAKSAMSATQTSLKSSVRKYIRTFMLDLSSRNLIVRIQKLHIPRELKDYLCFIE